MAVFSAIAAALVTAGATAFWASVGAAVITAGIMMGTAKLLGVYDKPNLANMKDPGVKIQLPPATDNRIPVFYGRSFTGSIICDVNIKNQNNTMVYCMVIGEKTDSGTYTVNQIFRDDAKLNFSGANVISVTDPNSTNTVQIANKIRCRVYAGNAQNLNNQIFPASGKVAAQTLMTTIDATTNYEDLVYAIFEMDYDAENGLTHLGAITYDITNSLSEPSNVLLDYCRNSRYGAGLSNAELDLTSFNSMHDYCTDQVDYLNSVGSTVQHDRWKIDGMLSTHKSVHQNIDTICQSSSTFFTFDTKNGKFKVVPNRAATTSEKNAAFVFDDDNILGSIEISSTELYSLYNAIDAEYPDVTRKDQTNVVNIQTPGADRNTNEPDNSLDTRFEIVNDAPRVHNLANIDLRQSRVSTMLKFDADYSAIVVDVGDVVKVTNSLYGFSEKLFRVMRVTESESTEGMLMANFILLEYSDDVYTHNTVQTGNGVVLPGILNWWTNYNNSSINIGNIIIVDDPMGSTANTVYSNNGASITNNIDFANIALNSNPYVGPTNPFLGVPITIPDIPGLDRIDISVDKPGANVANSNVQAEVMQVKPPSGNALFTPGEQITVPIKIPELGIDTSYSIAGPLKTSENVTITASGYSTQSGAKTNATTTANILVSPKGGRSALNLGDVQGAFQVDEAPAVNVAMVDATTDRNGTQLGAAGSIFTPAVTVPLGGIDFGEHTVLSSVVPVGQTANANAVYDIAFETLTTTTYEEVDDTTAAKTPTGNVFTVTDNGTGISSGFGFGQIPPVLKDDFKFEISPEVGLAAATALGANTTGKAYLPTNVSIQPVGNSS